MTVRAIVTTFGAVARLVVAAHEHPRVPQLATLRDVAIRRTRKFGVSAMDVMAESYDRRRRNGTWVTPDSVPGCP